LNQVVKTGKKASINMSNSNNINKKKEEISILKLISSCVDACSRGCEVIRFVNNKRLDKTKNGKNNDNEFNVQYKVADDPRSALTEADLASQRVILYCLRDVWGNDLKIVGEEDSDDADDNDNKKEEEEDITDEQLCQKYNVYTPNQKPIDCNLLPASTFSDLLVPLSELTLYIDPMDGTREFVEQRLHNVQCLIGITWQGKPIGGIIGLPFLWNDNPSKICNNKDEKGVYAVCGLHWKDSSFVKMLHIQNNIDNNKEEKPSNDDTKVCETKNGDNDDDLWLSLGSCSSTAKDQALELDGTVLNVYTGDSNRIHKKHALNHLQEWTSKPIVKGSGNDLKTILDVCIAGGCGNKILRATAYGSKNDGNALCIIPPGTCSWDTAAPTAILFAALSKYGKQGKVTDMFGGQLVYDSTGRKVLNDLGSLISVGKLAGEYHEKLCKTLRADNVILNSLLKNYWNGSNDNLTAADEDVRLKLHRAQQESQAVDFARNECGYIMSCKDIESLFSEQVSSINGSELVGYSVPEKEVMSANSDSNDVTKCVIRLFWKRKESSKLPTSVVYQKIALEKENTYQVNLIRE